MSPRQPTDHHPVDGTHVAPHYRAAPGTGQSASAPKPPSTTAPRRPSTVAPRTHSPSSSTAAHPRGCKTQDLPAGCVWEDSEKPGGPCAIPAADRLFPWSPRIRSRSHRLARVWRSRLPQQHAVADDRRGAREGQDGNTLPTLALQAANLLNEFLIGWVRADRRRERILATGSETPTWLLPVNEWCPVPESWPGVPCIPLRRALS